MAEQEVDMQEAGVGDTGAKYDDSDSEDEVCNVCVSASVHTNNKVTNAHLCARY